MTLQYRHFQNSAINKDFAFVSDFCVQVVCMEIFRQPQILEYNIE